MMYINGRSVAFELCGFAIYRHFRKWVLPVVLFLFSLPAMVSSQDIAALNSQTGIVMEFVSTDTELPAAGTTFNVLKVTNNRSKSFSGALRITVPEGWRIIGADGASVSLNPGEEFMFPLRITIPPSVLGGISYMVNAELRGDDYYDYTTSYVSIAPVSRWDMYVDSKNIYRVSIVHRVNSTSVSLIQGMPMR